MPGSEGNLAVCALLKALSLPSSPQLALVSALTVNVAAHSLQVNDFQVRLRSVTRRMMATVSELSMWQATGIKLGAQQQELEVLLAEAMQRLEVRFQGCSTPMALFGCMPSCGVRMPLILCRPATAAELLHLR